MTITTHQNFFIPTIAGNITGLLTYRLLASCRERHFSFVVSNIASSSFILYCFVKEAERKHFIRPVIFSFIMQGMGSVEYNDFSLNEKFLGIIFIFHCGIFIYNRVFEKTKITLGQRGASFCALSTATALTFYLAKAHVRTLCHLQRHNRMPIY